MARLDVHPMPGRREGEVLGIQAKRLSHLTTRMVVLLLSEDIAPKPIAEHVLLSQTIASMAGRKLESTVASFVGHDASIHALDLLLVGD